ncbi:30S ribosomal protein S3 [Ureaplasma sp. ES3154-GEN]|uniref:30S ribosomal protein S3 n=1 Tax=Ureaplasma sp. ES3154-GEN TaxID=2984844 RepID=UPI0021E9197D|nr:30S ribosomal protein S3 [Ureaplasma sp. ES3154-GEN]MCV3743610.1 30S ribosomal protein S3 [Ureaplasma sp. ES3154-GEN]
MGQKVNPNGLRFGVNKQWLSRWVPTDEAQMGQWLIEDDKIRTYITSKYKNAVIDHVEIERDQQRVVVYVYAVQIGLLIGTEAAEKKLIELAINKIVGRRKIVSLKVIEVQTPELQAAIVAREIADAIENRVSFRIAQKLAIKKVLKAGAKGIKTKVSGRLGGVEMARVEGYNHGLLTLHTLRADIDYALAEAQTAYGIIGVKVWINRGELFTDRLVNNVEHAAKLNNNKQNNKQRRNFKPHNGEKRQRAQNKKESPSA